MPIGVDYGEYDPGEFAIDFYRCVGGCARGVRHLPSGKQKGSKLYTLADPAPKNLEGILIQELIDELRAEGFPPQPRRIGVKKMGKPRWSEADRQQ